MVAAGQVHGQQAYPHQCARQRGAAEPDGPKGLPDRPRRGRDPELMLRAEVGPRDDVVKGQAHESPYCGAIGTPASTRRAHGARRDWAYAMYAGTIDLRRAMPHMQPTETETEADVKLRIDASGLPVRGQ